MQPRHYEQTDQILLVFPQSETGPGHVPTALDAYCHSFFWPAPRRARWRRTRDLDPTLATSRQGVRECVVREFPAEKVRDWLDGFAGRLAVMPAGHADPVAFDQDVRTLRQDRFFDQVIRTEGGLTLLYDLRQQWARDFDYVLIDSRTGLTDVGGVCTRLLPDLMVAVMTLNRQGREGMASVLRQVGTETLFGFPVDTPVVVSTLPMDWPEQIKGEIEGLAETLGRELAEIRRLPLRPGLIIREQPFYCRWDAIPADDQLRVGYAGVAEAIRERNRRDVEYRLERARAALVANDAEPAERLASDLLAPSPPVPTRRLVKAMNEVADVLLGAPGPLEAAQRRRTLATRVLRAAREAPAHYPAERAMTLVNLARALAEYFPDDWMNRGGRLRAALAAYEEALRFYRPETAPREYARTVGNVLAALDAARDLGVEVDLAALLDRVREAVAERLPERDPAAGSRRR